MKSTRIGPWVAIGVGLFFLACSGSSESSRNTSTGPRTGHESSDASLAHPQGPSCDESGGHIAALVGDGDSSSKEHLIQSCEVAIWSKTLRACIVKSSSVHDVEGCWSAAQSFNAGMQVLCSAPDHVKTTDESRRNEMIAVYIARRLLNTEVVGVFNTIGWMSIPERREFLEELAGRAGISSCALAALPGWSV